MGTIVFNEVYTLYARISHYSTVFDVVQGRTVSQHTSEPY